MYVDIASPISSRYLLANHGQTGITNGQLQYISKISNMSQEFFPKYNLMNPSEVMKWIQFAVAILPLFGMAVPALEPAIIAMESFAQGGLGVANTFMPVPYVALSIPSNACRRSNNIIQVSTPLP